MRTDQKNKTKRLAYCAMLAALGCVILYMGAFFEVMDISMAVIASLCATLAVIEFGTASALSVYGVTAILSLILAPRSPAAMYLLFFGYYPILKEKLEALKPLTSWLLKELTFNLAAVAIVLVFRFLFLENVSYPLPLLIAVGLLAELVFILYDIALTRLISLYIFKLRKRFRFK